MSKNIGEFSHESQDDSRWDMGEVTPFGGEKDSGNATENLERDPSLSRQEKSAELDEAREPLKRLQRHESLTARIQLVKP